MEMNGEGFSFNDLMNGIDRGIDTANKGADFVRSVIPVKIPGEGLRRGGAVRMPKRNIAIAKPLYPVEAFGNGNNKPIGPHNGEGILGSIFDSIGVGLKKPRLRRGGRGVTGNNVGEVISPLIREKVGRQAGGYQTLVGGVPVPIQSGWTKKAMDKFGAENALVGNQVYSGYGVAHPAIGIPAEKLVRGGALMRRKKGGSFVSP
jgi:hypothetical protein